MSATTLSPHHSPLAQQPYSPATTTIAPSIKQQSSPSPLQAAALQQRKRKTMSLTQTYFLAHKARAKLSTEAARADHDLRLLVGHANLLDSLMLELADAEREQESWFNQSVRGASRQAQEEPSQLKKERHIQWADAIVEDPEDEEAVESASESDSESESDSDEYESDDDIDVEMHDAASLRRLPAQPVQSTINYHYNDKPLLSVEEDEVEDDEDDMEEDDLEEDYAQLQLVRTHSHSNSPPELVEHEPHDLDSSDDEDQDSMPPSPPDAILTFSEKDSKEQIHQQEQQSPQDHHGSFYSDGFYLPRRSPSRLVSAISVY